MGPKEIGAGFPIQHTEASKRGMFYTAANDTRIASHGTKALQGCTREGSEIGMGIQIADVKKTLGGVGKEDVWSRGQGDV